MISILATKVSTLETENAHLKIKISNATENNEQLLLQRDSARLLADQLWIVFMETLDAVRSAVAGEQDVDRTQLRQRRYAVINAYMNNVWSVDAPKRA